MSKGIVSARERVAVFHDEQTAMTKQVFAGYEEFSANQPTPVAFQVDTSSPQVRRTASKGERRYVLLPHWDPQAAADILHDHADDMGNPHRRLAAPVADQGLVDLAKQGGFTLHDHVGDGPTSGYMVSQDKHTEQMMPIESLTPTMINDFVHKNTSALSRPNNYLGGWLDGKNFYLDVSTHRPTLDRASHDAAMAHQLAIYDLDHNTSVNTPDAVWQAGDPGLALPEDHHQNLLTGSVVLGEHDWTQHTLGDPGDDVLYGYKTAAESPFPPAGANKNPDIVDLGEAPGSTHGAHIHQNKKTGEKWLVKPDTNSGGALAKLDVFASNLATQSGLDAPPTFEGNQNGVPTSAQLMYPNAKDAYSKEIDPEKITDEDLATIQKHHALDWMIGNHDAHGAQFIRDESGKLIGVDKAQAFKFANNDRLHWNFHPNGPMYGESEPIYNTLFRNFAKGGREVSDPRTGEVGKYIAGLQALPDKEYAEALRPYAEAAASHGLLGKSFSGLKSDQIPWTPKKFKANDVEAFLAHAVARKNSLMHDMGDLYDRAMAHRRTGTKIAVKKKSYAPDPTSLQSMHQQLGSHGAKVYADPQGQWLIKKPPEGLEFMSHLDKATADLQHMAGLTMPETHQINWHDGAPVTAVKMLDGAHQAFRQPPTLSEVHPTDLLTLQKHQALDWMIGNHDSHAGNFLRVPPKNPADPADPGELVGIDKGQAAKYFGRDKLANDFHPNFYAREPLYNQLWRDYASGKPGEMNDPRHGDLGNFVTNLQAIPDEHLKHMFRPYAEEAAKAGRLANVDDGRGQIDPRRGLRESSLQPNDPEAFLEAMVKRKKTLREELGSFHDRQSAQRHHAIESTALRNPQTNEVGPMPKLDGPGLHVLM